MKDLARDVAKDVLGAAENGSAKALLVVPPSRPLGQHLKDRHVKEVAQDAAQKVAQNMAQDVAQDVLGAAKDGSVKVLILPIAIFQQRNPRPTHPTPALG